ncbi:MULTISPECIES: outer membrane lipoprotein chaperone LolA [unclassified Roseateles]|uniref:outer membrane lipoprotein chaperone LolA n=1 Tax=unclassified Roseateles TaxID=2626991 RepID=UPI0006FB6826|nr:MULTISPECIES: outer membrane lipoprotein chaperone LolA [unclassified Roseateles]KQW41202.1 outer membrane lipoprotein carrier protein LolA [Pelomonas sp. Root405]KRA67974.1 outer membrane lipoprotein carrier protein LolA [Pelomonas sp. Root662]
MKKLLCSLAVLIASAAHADAVDALREFGRDVKSGKANFTQTVTSPDGKRKKVSSGSFEFQRPNQFRFAYAKPFEQVIVADGTKVWIYDADLNQASSRKLAEALGATPAALLAGTNIERDFALKAQPSEGGIDWVQATPKQADSTIQSLKLGFRTKELAAMEIVDGFGQRSRLDFSAVQANVPVAAERFQFKLPAGADLIEQ